MTNIIDMLNTADTINKAVDIVHAEMDAMMDARLDARLPRSNNEKENIKNTLEELIAKNPLYKRRNAEALADLYFDLLSSLIALREQFKKDAEEEDDDE